MTALLEINRGRKWGPGSNLRTVGRAAALGGKGTESSLQEGPRAHKRPDGEAARTSRHSRDALRGLAVRERVNVGRGERIPGDPPVAALDFFDHAPSNLTHVFALNRDH